MMLRERRLQLRRMVANVSRRKRAPLLLIVLAAAWVLASGGVALAHVQIDVGDGRYVMEIGFRDEPAYAGQPNALWLNVQEFATGGAKPVDGLASTLTAEVSRDGQVMNLPLVPKGDGTYEGQFVPTATGDYTFRITGNIGDASVDESVTSGPTTFNAVEPLSSIAFPPQTGEADQAAAANAAVLATAEQARLFGIAGIVVGLLGLVVAAIALARPRQPRVESTDVPVAATGKLIR
jgi:hypothetical protein